MEDLYQKLQHLLKTGAGYLDDDGELNLTLIQNKAYDGDADLLDLLLGKAEFKRQFFTQTA
ncbi:MAG: hypothetical protein K0U45_08895, partial [Alphaproteobacteria bacterium]|nr:hypothetical protein [Alphaproteobacteria bacterium]